MRKKRNIPASNAFKERKGTKEIIPDDLYQSVSYLKVNKDSEGQRVDNFLRRVLPKIPKSRIYQMVRKGEVRVNKKRCKVDDKLSENDTLRIPPIRSKQKEEITIAERWYKDIPEMVIHQDKHYLVINKPAFVPVHSGSSHDVGLVDIINKVFKRQNENDWLLCHRLDKDTSGCLLFASGRKAQNAFQEELVKGCVYKSYLGLAKGIWNINTTIITDESDNIYYDDGQKEVPEEIKHIIEGFTNNQQKSKKIDNRISITDFKAEEFFKKSTLFRAVIKTGRTHQIRKQAMLSKHPVAMDDRYGDFSWNKSLKKEGLKRMFLHSHILKFRGLEDEIHVSAQLPVELDDFLYKNN